MIRPRDLTLYRPYADEIPWDLLAADAVDEDALRAVLELDLMRVAKLEGQIVGAYGIRPLTEIRHELVALRVLEAHRRKGYGRWILGHAIGLAESRGGREILVRGTAAARFLARTGFEQHGNDLLLELTPE